MTINKTQDNGNIMFALDGRLDTTTSPKLQEVLIPAFDETNKVVLDFNELAYISSAGLRVLLMGQKTATSKDAELIIKNVSDDIMEVFDMTGFSDMLHIEKQQ